MKKLRTWAIILVILAALVGLAILSNVIFDSPAALIQAHMHIPRPRPEVIMQFGPVGITNTVFSSFVAMLVLVVIAALVSRGLRRKSDKERIQHPSGWQNLIEWAVEYVINLLEGAAGSGHYKKKPLGRHIFPLVGTLFIFIIFANWLSLLPGFSTILVVPPVHTEAPQEEHSHLLASLEGSPVLAPEEEEHAGSPIVWWIFGREKGEAAHEPAPLLRAANSHLAITAGMAIVAIVMVQAWSIGSLGFVGYLKHLATDAPPLLKALMFPLHVLSEISRIISLSARLFGNLYGGDVLLAVIFNLIGPLLPAVFFGIEAFFYYIQALLFSVLTTVYISLAVAHGGEDHH
ncbi:MAG: F0F1 ATP synthase subunit A [Chloroflexia bacterium]|nr:F0F1 ATP synthase subunit A [Chloroflexia bacterium]